MAGQRPRKGWPGGFLEFPLSKYIRKPSTIHLLRVSSRNFQWVIGVDGQVVLEISARKDPGT